MQLSISDNIDKVAKNLSKTQRKQVPFAIAQTLTKLAYEASQEEKKQAPRHMDRPTPYTVKGFRYRKANKRSLEALVYVQDREYMDFTVHGGRATPRGRALVHPARNSKLNKYGNMPRRYVSKALANKQKFFSGIPKGMVGQENAGIWQRYGRGKNQRIRMVAQWKPSRRYQAQFPFYEIAGQVVAGRANKIFNQQLERALRTAR